MNRKLVYEKKRDSHNMHNHCLPQGEGRRLKQGGSMSWILANIRIMILKMNVALSTEIYMGQIG